MESNIKLFSPKNQLLFITLPQALLAVFLYYAYQISEIVPSLPLVILFSIQIAFNVYIVVDVILSKNSRPGNNRIRIIQLIGFIAIVSASIPFLLKQFNFPSALSPETIYSVLCMIPLIYIVMVILHRNEIPLLHIRTRIIICICFPFLITFLVTVILRSKYIFPAEGDMFSFVSDIILNVLVALFFIFICLITSVLYHFKAKKPLLHPGDAAAVHDTPIDMVCRKKRSIGYYIFIVCIALVLPVFSLYLNNVKNDMITGNFSSIWFYIISIANGIAMLIPQKEKWVALAALFVKSIGLLYVFYFVVVMLKYIPIVLSYSFLVFPLLALTPAVLFIAELLQIINDFKYLRLYFSVQKITAVFVCGMLLLLGGFTGNCYIHKVNFDNAMCYLDANVPEYPRVNISLLKTTLEKAKQPRQTYFFDILASNSSTPILSNIYHSIVFNNKLLTEDSYDSIIRIFLPDQAKTRSMKPQPSLLSEKPGSVKIHSIKTDTSLDRSTGLYRTWIQLQMKNESDRTNQEFSVCFGLPDGVYISGYYLDVFEERKYGIVSEKTAAQMIYDRIVLQSRDPGIIYYKQENIVELKVFPFDPGEIRNTGFLVMYKQSETINIGENTIMLKGDDYAAPVISGDTCFMPSSYKSGLEQKAARIPKYYFIADVSKPLWPEEQNTGLGGILTRIKKYAEDNSIADACVYITAYNVKKAGLDYLNLKYGEGGFNMALAMEMIYRDAKYYPDHYPVVIVASDNINKSSVPDNRKIIRDFPEIEYYYLINEDGSLTAISFADNCEYWITDKPLQSFVLTYEGFYFKDNGLSEIGYKNTRRFSDIEYGGDPYINALLLNEKIDKSASRAQIVETVKDSFSLGILTEYNSFIVLETKEQEDELRRRNEEFLNGKETIWSSPVQTQMSEPGIIAAVLLPALLLIARRLRRQTEPSVLR